MNDAIALLALSQIICLGALGYLYTQLQALRRRPHRAAASHTVREGAAAAPDAPARGTRSRQPHAVPAFDAPALLEHIRNSNMDVPALARKLRRSEDEIRLLLRRQGIQR